MAEVRGVPEIQSAEILQMEVELESEHWRWEEEIWLRELELEQMGPQDATKG